MRPVLLLAALTVVFYWKLTLSSQYTYLSSPDLVYQVLPWYQFQARAWQGGAFPLWDPYQWCGQPLQGQLQPGATFPLNWPLFWAPLKEGRLNLELAHWHFVAMHLLAALFMYACCRELGRGRPAAVLAGAGFSLGGYLGTTTWPQMMNGAVWTPLVFLFYHRAGKAATRLASVAAAAGCGAALGMALLAGHHQVPMFVALALAGAAVFQRRLRTLALAVVFAVLVGALALLPAWEYGSSAYRWLNLPSPLRMDQAVPYAALQELGLIPLSLLGLVVPLDKMTANPFVGLVAVSLALVGTAACWQARAVRLHACLALGALAYAVGSYSWFQGLLYATVPFLDKARSPGHAVALLHFAVLVLAAHGADALFTAPDWRRRLAQGLLAAGTVGWAAQLLLLAGGGPRSDRAGMLMLASSFALLLGALLGPGWKPKLAPAGMLLILLAELAGGTRHLILPRQDPPAGHEAVIRFLRSQPQPFRFEADSSEIPYNLGDQEGLEDAAGYLASVSAGLYDFVGLDWERTPQMLNRVYIVRREKTRPEHLEVFSTPGGLKVFRDPGAYPRAWLVEGLQEVASRPQAAALMQSRTFDPRREAFLFEKAPPLEACPGDGMVEMVARELDRVAVRVRTPCTRMVVLSEPMFPGWKARIDGQEAPIYSAYGALRGVMAPPGDHLVETIYRPLSVYAGAALTATGLAVWLGLWAAWRRESRRSAGPAGPGSPQLPQ